MKIITRDDNKVRFDELAEGDTFRGDNGQIYIKTIEIDDSCCNPINAVALTTGELDEFYDSDLVTIVKGAFVEE